MSEKKAIRVAYGEALAALGEENEKVVVLDADLAHATMTATFANKFPQRFFNAGIAESNMIDMAAGLSTMGFIPFASTFAVFAGSPSGFAYIVPALTPMAQSMSAAAHTITETSIQKTFIPYFFFLARITAAIIIAPIIIAAQHIIVAKVTTSFLFCLSICSASGSCVPAAGESSAPSVSLSVSSASTAAFAFSSLCSALLCVYSHIAVQNAVRSSSER